MKKPIEMPFPKCAKCKKTLDPEFTTEKQEGEKGKPQVIILFGRCEKCNTITVCNIIKTKDVPNEKEFLEFIKEVEDQE